MMCNLGECIEEVLPKVFACDSSYFDLNDSIVEGQRFYLGNVKIELPEIKDVNYNLRCNRMLLHLYNKIKTDIDLVIEKCGRDRIGVVVATTNSGVEEFERTSFQVHCELGNPALFLKELLGLNSYHASISTACTSGIKAFATGKKLLENGICDAVIVGGADSMSKLPVFGFNSLEVLSGEKSNPFSKNRSGMNIAEGAALFILERDIEKGIKLLGIGETSDAYHAATPDPNGVEASNAMKNALEDASSKPEDIDYVNLHGTGTISNDLMEANAIYNVFKDNVYVSSTKSMTGHCLGAASSVEMALCCAMLDKNLNPQRQLLPHVYDGQYDEDLPKIKLVDKLVLNENMKTCMCNSFGFGGTNAVAILGV